MKKIFTLMAVAALSAVAAQRADATTVQADVKTWLTPTTFVSYVADLEIQDEDNPMFSLPKGLANSEYGLYFRKVQDDTEADQIEVYGSEVTATDYLDDDWVSNGGTCYIGLNDTYVMFIYYCGTHIYNEIAEDNMSGYVTIPYDVYDYEAWTGTVESWGITTTISWPAKEVEETIEGATYTNGRTGETTTVDVVKYVNGLFTVPAFQGKEGYDLTFDENGVWSAISEMCFNPEPYGEGYEITVPLTLPVDGGQTGAKEMIVTSAVTDMEAKTLTIKYQYTEDGDDPAEDIYTDVLSWGDGAGVESIEVDNATNASEVLYNLQGIRVNRENAAPGLYISRSGDKTQKVVIR